MQKIVSILENLLLRFSVLSAQQISVLALKQISLGKKSKYLVYIHTPCKYIFKKKTKCHCYFLEGSDTL